MKKYKVKVWLEEEYDDIIAENEEDAFIQASDFAMEGGSWGWEVEEIGSVEKCDNDHDCEHCDWVECPIESEDKE